MASNFSEREIKYLAAACRSFKGDPQLDIDKFSGLTNLTTGSARNAWAALRKKMATSTTDDDDSATPKPSRRTTTTPKFRAKNGAESSAHKSAGTTPTPRSNAKRTKAMTDTVTDDSEDAAENPSPSKKARSTPSNKPGPKIKHESVDEVQDVDGDDEELEELEENPLFGMSGGVKLESSTPGHYEDEDEV